MTVHQYSGYERFIELREDNIEQALDLAEILYCEHNDKAGFLGCKRDTWTMYLNIMLQGRDKCFQLRIEGPFKEDDRWFLSNTGNPRSDRETFILLAGRPKDDDAARFLMRAEAAEYFQDMLRLGLRWRPTYDYDEETNQSYVDGQELVIPKRTARRRDPIYVGSGRLLFSESMVKHGWHQVQAPKGA